MTRLEQQFYIKTGAHIAVHSLLEPYLVVRAARRLGYDVGFKEVYSAAIILGFVARGVTASSVNMQKHLKEIFDLAEQVVNERPGK